MNIISKSAIAISLTTLIIGCGSSNGEQSDSINNSAKPSQKIINQCLKASDFQGCVRVMTGQGSVNNETKITVDLDKVRNTGNSCPDGYAYKGAGYCQEIRCFSGGQHDPRLGGKGHKCIGRPLIGRYTMQFGQQTIRATTEITQIIYQMALAAAAVNSF